MAWWRPDGEIVVDQDDREGGGGDPKRLPRPSRGSPGPAVPRPGRRPILGIMVRRETHVPLSYDLKRLVAQELALSFVPDAEQLWRTVMRRKYQVTRNRVQLHNRLESLLEEAHIKLSSDFVPRKIENPTRWVRR